MLVRNLSRIFSTNRKAAVVRNEVFSSLYVNHATIPLRMKHTRQDLEINLKTNEKSIRWLSTSSPMASYDQTVDEFPSIIIGADDLVPKGPFAVAQAHVS